MDSYMSTQYTRAREPVKRVRRVCKPCMATHKKIHRLRKEERWDELERAIEDGRTFQSRPDTSKQSTAMPKPLGKANANVDHGNKESLLDWLSAKKRWKDREQLRQKRHQELGLHELRGFNEALSLFLAMLRPATKRS